MTRLTPDEIRAALDSDLPGWRHDDEALRKEFAFRGFSAAVAFVDRLVEPANAARHHPDLEVGYGRVRVSLSTHDEGGVTERDVAMARTVESIAGTPSP